MTERNTFVSLIIRKLRSMYYIIIYWIYQYGMRLSVHRKLYNLLIEAQVLTGSI